MSTVREQILLTTSILLEKQGFHGTGLNEIIKESGAPKGSLYYYFPQGKEQIVSEAILQAGKLSSERIRVELKGNLSPARSIFDFILRIAEQVELSGFGSGGPLTTVAMETATGSERINSACQAAHGMRGFHYFEIDIVFVCLRGTACPRKVYPQIIVRSRLHIKQRLFRTSKTSLNHVSIVNVLPEK